MDRFVFISAIFIINLGRNTYGLVSADEDDYPNSLPLMTERKYLGNGLDRKSLSYMREAVESEMKARQDIMRIKEIMRRDPQDQLSFAFGNPEQHLLLSQQVQQQFYPKPQQQQKINQKPEQLLDYHTQRTVQNSYYSNPPHKTTNDLKAENLKGSQVQGSQIREEKSSIRTAGVNSNLRNSIRLSEQISDNQRPVSNTDPETINEKLASQLVVRPTVNLQNQYSNQQSEKREIFKIYSSFYYTTKEPPNRPEGHVSLKRSQKNEEDLNLLGPRPSTKDSLETLNQNLLKSLKESYIKGSRESSYKDQSNRFDSRLGAHSPLRERDSLENFNREQQSDSLKYSQETVNKEQSSHFDGHHYIRESGESSNKEQLSRLDNRPSIKYSQETPNKESPSRLEQNSTPEHAKVNDLNNTQKIWRIELDMPEMMKTIKKYTGLSLTGLQTDYAPKSIGRSGPDVMENSSTPKNILNEKIKIEVTPLDWDTMMKNVKNIFTSGTKNGRRYFNPLFYGHEYVESSPGAIKVYPVSYPSRYQEGKLMYLLKLKNIRDLVKD